MEGSQFTDSNGVGLLTLTEFFEDNQTKAVYTPHSINASIAGRFSNSTIVNLTQTNSTIIYFNLQGEVDVYNTSRLFTNSSAYAALRFFMRNLALASNVFNWGFDTGQSNFNSTLTTTLAANEGLFASSLLTPH